MNETPPSLSHLDEAGQVRMVDVGGKAATARTAIASGRVRLSPVAYGLLTQPGQGKGEVLNTARVAGILAAKRCAELIPLCHSLPLSFVGVDFSLDDATHTVEVRGTCRSDYRTGVEMEAMTAVSVAALTIYDMCKAADKGIVIDQVRLEYKSGGKVASGEPSIELLYFARVAELTGKRGERWPLAGPVSGGELLAALEARYPDLAPAARLKLAINQYHAKPSATVRAGDEVAVFEPVTGG